MAGMYKNQLQELAQRSCFNLPSYTCVREGPDHAPRFKASVNFNGEIFEGPSCCTTLRQAEHAAAEVALTTLSTRGPSRSLAAKVLDETGVYKNLLQETAHRAGLNLPVYTTIRSGPGHLPVFTCTVELASMNFTGEPAKTKKQAQKNAAMAAWAAIKQAPNFATLSQNKESEVKEEQEQVLVTRVLSNLKPKDEKKTVRERDRDRQSLRGRMMLGYRDNTSNCSINTSNHHKWRSLDQLPDVSSLQPTQPSNFWGPPSASKIFHKFPFHKQSSASSQDPSSSLENKQSIHHANMSIPAQIRSQLQVKIQEVSPPIEGHQKDEVYWFNGMKSDGKVLEKDHKSADYRPSSTYINLFVSPNSENLNSGGAFRSSLPPNPKPMPALPAIRHPAILRSGGYYSDGIAPAVNIRSVIPVCSAPPIRPSSNPPPVQRKEASGSASSQTEEIISKLNRISFEKSRPH